MPYEADLIRRIRLKQQVENVKLWGYSVIYSNSITSLLMSVTIYHPTRRDYEITLLCHITARGGSRILMPADIL